MIAQLIDNIFWDSIATKANLSRENAKLTIPHLEGSLNSGKTIPSDLSEGVKEALLFYMENRHLLAPLK